MQGSSISGLLTVSIHAPREGCDTLIKCTLYGTTCFNSRTPGGVRQGRDNSCSALQTVSIHAPREGCDSVGFTPAPFSMRFQFTHPGRGATSSASSSRPSARFQFTHPGRGATIWANDITHRITVSIHAPREGCDRDIYTIMGSGLRFNSRTPGGVRQDGTYLPSDLTDVSIHAPREGCDSCRNVLMTGSLSFNSRTPGGVRLQNQLISSQVEKFQFTHPGRGATAVVTTSEISI